MKTIITVVGTSVFTNLIKDGCNAEIAEKYDQLKNARFSEWDDYEDDIDKHENTKRKGLRKLVREGIECNTSPENASAEIESMLKIGKLDDNITVHLLATDTILSVLAAEIIKQWFEEHHSSISLQFNRQQDVIKNLQVQNLKEFKEGLKNFIVRFYLIIGSSLNNFILNITGGYKAVIPYMTILGQIHKIDICYIFEETNEVIKIPRLPLKQDDSLFEKYFDVFAVLENNPLNEKDYYHFVQAAENFLDFEQDGEFTLNSLGYIFWENYKRKFFTFFASDEVWEDYQKQRKVQDFLRQTFQNEMQREKYVVCEDTHKTVCKKFNDTPRIYWFKSDKPEKLIYIYKTFEDHDAHEKYIRDVKFDDEFKKSIIKNAKPRKILIQNV